MKNRDLSKFVEADPDVAALLTELTRPMHEVPVGRYREIMRAVGVHLARGLVVAGLGRVPDRGICIVCTVEDADYLAAGVIDGLQRAGIRPESIFLQCFWNERVREDDVSLSPVSKQYAEPFDSSQVTYVILKSIISGACVVKSNLTRVLSRASAQEVYVAAPVLFGGAQARLEQEFPKEISSLFRYVWFATDYDKTGEYVTPGIGGSVYKRLGLGNESTKNKYLPEIVKLRRRERFALDPNTPSSGRTAKM